MNMLARYLAGVLLNRGVDLYHSNVASDAAYIVVSGAITLYEEAPPSSSGGETELSAIWTVKQRSSLLSGTRAKATAATIPLRLPAARLPSPCQRTQAQCLRSEGHLSCKVARSVPLRAVAVAAAPRLRAVEEVAPSMVFGEEEVLAGCRRVTRAEATAEGTLLLRIPAHVYLRYAHARMWRTPNMPNHGMMAAWAMYTGRGPKVTLENALTIYMVNRV